MAATHEPRRVLLVTRNFPPLIGGMERLLQHVYLELSAGFDTALVGPSGCTRFTAAGARVASCPLSRTGVFLLCLQWQAARLARSVKPHLVLAGSGVAAPAALGAARCVGARTACYLHGLDVVVDSAVYRKLFIPAIKRCDALIANSRHTAALAAQIGIDPAKLIVLNPGVSIRSPSTAVPRGVFRDRVNAHGRKLLLSVGRIHRRKGLAEFVEKAMPKLATKHPDVLLAIVGEEPGGALRGSEGEVKRIQAAARLAEVETHVVFTGAVSDELLEAAYTESDLLVFPVLDIPGDVEGFGMVAIEAAAHELPTFAFSVGGVPEAVRHGVSGHLVPVGDYPAYVDAITRYFQSDLAPWRERCRQHARAFSWEGFGERLRSICAELMARRNL